MENGNWKKLWQERLEHAHISPKMVYMKANIYAENTWNGLDQKGFIFNPGKSATWFEEEV